MMKKKIVWDVFNNNIKFDFQPFVKNSKDMDFLKELLTVVIQINFGVHTF